jgi:phosphotransferase system IIB component
LLDLGSVAFLSGDINIGSMICCVTRLRAGQQAKGVVPDG